MAYTIIIREQVTPEFITVHGAEGDELRRNPGPPRIYPATMRRVVWADLSGLYAADPTRRVELLDDPAGTATLADVKRDCPGLFSALAEQIRAEGNRRLLQLAHPYQDGERETWMQQQREAEAWQTSPNNADAVMITAMARTRGITVDELVERIMGNVALFRAASGSILGLQQRLLDEIAAATDLDRLLEITWPTM